jgi:hypothetical protein
MLPFEALDVCAVRAGNGEGPAMVAGPSLSLTLC